MLSAVHCGSLVDNFGVTSGHPISRFTPFAALQFPRSYTGWIDAQYKARRAAPCFSSPTTQHTHIQPRNSPSSQCISPLSPSPSPSCRPPSPCIAQFQAAPATGLRTKATTVMKMAGTLSSGYLLFGHVTDFDPAP
jgi:hypothetical protein